MPCHQRCQSMLVGGSRPVDACALPQLVQRLEVLQGDVGRDPEVDEAGDLVHADRREPVHPGRAGIHRPEEAARLVVPLEGVLQDAFALLFAQLVQVERAAARLVSRAPLERRERPGVPLEQVHRAPQVFDERLSNQRLDLPLIPPDQRVQHQRHPTLARVPRLAPCLSVQCQLGTEFLDALPQQVGQHARTNESCLTIGLGTPRRGQPDGQLRLHRARQCAHRYHAAIYPRELHCLAPPQPSHHVDVARHDRLVVAVRLRPQHEVVRLPPRRERHPSASPRDAVHHCPLLGDARGMMQRQHDAAAAHVHPVRDGSHRSARHCRVGIDAAEGVEVALRASTLPRIRAHPRSARHRAAAGTGRCRPIRRWRSRTG